MEADIVTEYYRYDGYNRLKEYIGIKDYAEYSYNINGLRESKTVNGKRTRYVYDEGNILSEITEDNNYTYYRGTELMGYTSHSGERWYYRQDAHGNVTGLLSPDGAEEKEYSYNAYGEKESFAFNPMGDGTIIYQWKAETEQLHNPFGYCGEYQDLCSGLIYLRNRYYDPSIGRFITEDPARDGLNWYVYCRNNPVNYIDPSGTVPVETIIDLASIGWSFSDFVSNPSVANFGFLAWDVAAALVPYAPGSYSAKTIKAGTQILSKSDNYVKSGVWAMKAFDRGYEIEKALGGMANNFPTIDKYVKAQARAGIMWLSSVTSIKSIDITASSYKSGNTMKNVLKNYVDDLAKFKETIYKGVHYKLDSTGSKILEVAIPPVEMTSNQAEIFQEIKDYATEKGIELITRIIK